MNEIQTLGTEATTTERIAASRAELQAMLPNTEAEKIVRLNASSRWAALIVALRGDKEIQEAIPEWMEAYWSAHRGGVVGPTSIEEFEAFFTDEELLAAARHYVAKQVAR